MRRSAAALATILLAAGACAAASLVIRVSAHILYRTRAGLRRGGILKPHRLYLGRIGGVLALDPAPEPSLPCWLAERAGARGGALGRRARHEHQRRGEFGLFVSRASAAVSSRPYPWARSRNGSCANRTQVSSSRHEGSTTRLRESRSDRTAPCRDESGCPGTPELPLPAPDGPAVATTSRTETGRGSSMSPRGACCVTYPLPTLPGPEPPRATKRPDDLFAGRCAATVGGYSLRGPRRVFRGLPSFGRDDEDLCAVRARSRPAPCHGYGRGASRPAGLPSNKETEFAAPFGAP